MISQIFQYLTKKQINDAVTLIPTKSIQEMFLEQRNVSKVSVLMYNSFRIINKPNYTSFRDKVETNMTAWIWNQQISSNELNYNKYTIDRLNNNFMNSHKYMINAPNVMFTKVQAADIHTRVNTGNRYTNQYDIKPDNVYRDLFRMSQSDYNGKITESYKKGKDIMPWEYGSLDLWKKQETYADFDFEKWRSFRDTYGYAGTYIPRNVDRDPESFGLTHRDPERASLSDVPRAFDNSDYYRAKGLC